MGSEEEEEEWGDLEEAEVGLDQTQRDWQERRERKKGKKGKNTGSEGGRPEHGHKLKLLVLYVHGIGGRSADANAELKITDVCSMIKLHDIAVLTETNK